MTSWAWVACHNTHSPITYQWGVMTNCMSGIHMRERRHLYVRIIKEFLPDLVQRRTDWRMNLPKQLLPTWEARVCLSKTWKRNWSNDITHQQEKIGRKDHGYFTRHIWAPPITLGGHARYYKLILGMDTGQRTLSLPVVTPNGVTVPVKEGGYCVITFWLFPNKAGELLDLVVQGWNLSNLGPISTCTN